MEKTVVKLGNGKIAVTGGLQVPDQDTIVGLLFLEPDKGSGAIAADVPGRQRGVPVFPDEVNGTILEFSNPMSIDVVIEQLATMRCDWNRALNDPAKRRELWETAEAAIEERSGRSEQPRT